MGKRTRIHCFAYRKNMQGINRRDNHYLNLISETTRYANERKLRSLQEFFEETEPTTKWAGKLATSFTEILQEDRELRMWFDDWKRDILGFHDIVKEMIVEEPDSNWIEQIIMTQRHLTLGQKRLQHDKATTSRYRDRS